MARRRKSKSNGTNNNNHHHFPPERILRFLLRLKSALELVEARTISREELEALTGRPVGTINSWFDGVRMLQAEFLFSLLERLPQKLREELIESVCRVQPTLTHPTLAHDPIVIDQLETLLRQRNGFAIIQGGSEYARGFLWHALGNSCRAVNFGQRIVTGLDVQRHSSWSPVPGVIQLPFHGDIRQQVQRMWAGIKKAEDGSLVLLGRLWSQVSPLHSEIVHLATRCQVIVADTFTKPEELPRRLPEPVHVLTVASMREQPDWIRVTVQRR